VVDLKDYKDLLLADNEKLEEAMTVAQHLNWKNFGNRNHMFFLYSDRP